MRRRDFLTFVGGTAVAWPLSVRAQQGQRIRRIGVLQPGDESDPLGQGRMAQFVQALKNLGWTQGANVRIDARRGGGDPERIRLHAAELVGMQPDVIWSDGGALSLLPLKRATSAIPIVFTLLYDPIGSGFITNLARPGGNVTGFTLGEFSMGGKLLELLKEAAPKVSVVAVLLNLEQAPHVAMWRAIEATAPSFGVRLVAADAQRAAEIERAIEAFAREPNGGLIVLPSPVFSVERDLITQLAVRYRLPAAYGLRFLAERGGLLSYGADDVQQARQAASYVDRILRGEKPADLPVQQPTKFQLVINLMTAKAIGLDVPPLFIARADEVIE
jgi:putative ABC transport system substrate-binding protein